MNKKEIIEQAEDVVTSNPKTIDTDNVANILETQSKNITPHSINPNDQPNDDLTLNDVAAVTGNKTCEDIRYKKYFKMLHFGVPPQAVKMKMDAEGIDPHILE